MKKIASLDDLNFHHVLAETPGAAVVFFPAPDCGACHSLRKALEAFLHNYEPLPVFELDAVDSSGMVNALEIFHLPAMFLYVDGQYHRELRCEPLAVRIGEEIRRAIDLPPEEEP